MRKKAAAIVLSFSMVASTWMPAATVQATEYEESTTEYVVQLEDAQSVEEVLEENAEAVSEKEESDDLKEEQVLVLNLTPSEAEALENREDVVSIEENIIFQGSSAEVEEPTAKKKAVVGKDMREEQWNLKAIHLPQEREENQEEIKVAVLDSGVLFDKDVPVEGNIAISDVLESENVMFDDASGHGTGIAGMIAAQDNEDRIRGIHPEAKVYSIRVLNENNQATLSQVIAGIYKAIDLDCKILNMSFGTMTDSEALHQAVRSAYDAGMLLVAAGGNTEGASIEYPAAYPEVMAVGATDNTGNKIQTTSDGEELEILAPGSQIPTTGLFGGVMITEGTSIATAQVSAAASLLWSKDSTKSAGFIRSLLKNTTQDVAESGISGSGLLDIEKAEQMYTEMENIYVEEAMDYQEIQENNREAEAYDEVELVNGLWTKKNHQDMSQNAATGYKISATNLTILSTAAQKADYEPYNAAAMLHATGNYVEALHFLYECAAQLRSGKAINAAVSAAEKVALKHDENGELTETRAQLKKQVTTLLNTSIVSGVSETSAEARYYKVLGFALHLTGDTFAHRTIVPKYTVAGTNPKNVVYSTNAKSANAKFGTSDFKEQGTHTKESDAILKTWAKSSHKYQDQICRRWKCFQRTVNLGVMEFKDIKNFASNKTKDYEDNSKFCTERFVDAQTACDVLFSDSYDKEVYDGIGIFAPVEKNVMLNNLKKYSKEAGMDITCFTDTEWAKISTPDMY